MIRNRFTSVAALATLPRLRLALVPAAALLLVACASTPPNSPSLNEARALYNQAVERRKHRALSAPGAAQGPAGPATGRSGPEGR